MRDSSSDHVAWHGAPTPAPRVVDDGGRVSSSTDAASVVEITPPDRSLRPLIREVGALILATAAVILAAWSLWTLGGLPAEGLFVAGFLAYIARILGYWDAPQDNKG